MKLFSWDGGEDEHLEADLDPYKQKVSGRYEKKFTNWRELLSWLSNIIKGN